MDVELVSCLFELPPSDRSISGSFNCRYDFCWNCFAAMNESYSCGNALRTMAIFRFPLIFSSADCSLSILFRNRRSPEVAFYLEIQRSQRGGNSMSEPMLPEPHNEMAWVETVQCLQKKTSSKQLLI